ncbi:C45 family autoproteolytic acyltransferase/hydolase [Amycolatopsis sp. cmx-11-51]|uniref:C45 family autoproteolytic acyltransferase/hydolase n=1 Tax=Amycolatopsis sp. cmx-11-51 TaxID=2785797 RepID=UPI0039E2AD3B
MTSTATDGQPPVRASSAVAATLAAMTYIAGSPEDFLAVRHLTLRGTQAEIGHALAAEMKARSGWSPPPIDPIVARARRVWFARNWPQYAERAAGFAEAYGLPVDAAVSFDDASALPAGSGCSAVWNGGTLGRNYDFFTLSWTQLGAVMAGADPVDDATVPMASRPYVLTTIPDDGIASTSLSMSTVDGAMEGVNEAGLVVALLMADIEAAAPLEHDPGPQAGLSVPQVCRYLLDTCENVDEAKEALMLAKQYDHGAPCHYIVADASGRGFVYERGAYDVEYFVEVADGPLCVTNHPLHRHPDIDALPEDTPGTFLTYRRLRTLTKEADTGPRDALDAVSVAIEPGAPWRTLWRSVFDPAARTMSTRFYLGDGENGAARHSPELTFGVSR